MSFADVKAAWLKRVDAQLLQLVENYESLLSNCQLDPNATPSQLYRESLQLSLHADNMNSAVDNLLALTSEIRWAHLTENYHHNHQL